MPSVFTNPGTQVDVDDTEKLLDLLHVLLAPVASLGGMYIACTKLGTKVEVYVEDRGMYRVFAKPGTKVDVHVEDRRSSLTFSMFSLPRLALPWAG
jgi:hypothetical protein